MTKGGFGMKLRVWIGMLSTLVALFAGIAFGENATEPGESQAEPPRPTPCLPAQGCIPTFSTQNLGSMGSFYVGGKWVGEPGKEVMSGAMFVEVWVPKRIEHPYPIVFVQGGRRSNAGGLDTNARWTAGLGL